jgi:CRISPR-associated exonuclease Cas4
LETLSISGVVACHRCPVGFSLGRDSPVLESPRYTLAKQISYHLGGLLNPARIWREVLTVATEPDPEMEEILRTWVKKCEMQSWKNAVEFDVLVKSSRLGIHGVVDRIFDDEPYFALVRSSDAPTAGVWAADRIRVACYSICVKETLGLDTEAGIVEYVPSGIARACIPQPRDKRAALRAIKVAKDITNGAIPRRPRRAPCDNCYLREICTPGAKRLSEFL